MNRRVQLYTVNPAYIRHLIENDEHVMRDDYKRRRLYIGLFDLNYSPVQYVIPLSSPKLGVDYYIDEFGNDVVLKSDTHVVHYIEGVSDTGKHEIIGKVMLANIIPVPNSELRKVSIEKIPDEKYRSLVAKQYRFLRHFYNIYESLIKINYKRVEKAIEKRKPIKDTINYKWLDYVAFEWDRKVKRNRAECQNFVDELETIGEDQHIIQAIKYDIRKGINFETIQDKYNFGEYRQSEKTR